MKAVIITCCPEEVYAEIEGMGSDLQRFAFEQHTLPFIMGGT
jgi:hypothetical protein